MRHLLVDKARRSTRKRHGGDAIHVNISDTPVPADIPSDDLLELDTAIEALAGENERSAKVVICRFYGGLSLAETAQTLSISTATVKRDWQLAQAWLYQRIRHGSSPT